MSRPGRVASRRSVGFDWDESDVRVRASKKGSRPRTKQRPSYDDATIGRVVTVDRGRYTCVVEADAGGEHTVVAVRAKQLRRTPIVAGDQVRLTGDLSGEEGTLARLVELVERTTVLRRSADDTDEVERVVVANADQLLIVVAAANPQPRTGFIDRSLVAAYDAGIHPVLVITKTDLTWPEELIAHYRDLELTVLTCAGAGGSGDAGAASARDTRSGNSEGGPSGSDAATDGGSEGTRASADAEAHAQSEAPESLALDPQAVERVRAQMQGRVTVLLGHSGVGKSTLVNALTDAGRATGGVNAVTGRGRHTSSSAVAMRVPGCDSATWVVDTPGVRSFGLGHVDGDRIVEAFDDLGPAIADCPKGCTHLEDALDCALDEWVASGNAGPAGPARLASLRRLMASSHAHAH